MARARNSLIDLSATPYYHCISRCVRRAYLCGDDPYSGKNFDHRRQWLVERIKLLTSVFSIGLAAYSVMSNHYHAVFKVNKEDAELWSMDEVINRWYRLYHGNPLVDLYLKGEITEGAGLVRVQQIAEIWRTRLYDISWLMRNLNEFVARKANKEDGCSGRYWEGRYKSQALLDETALLSCLMYVDLNPVRAGIADSLSTSDYTSIKERIAQLKAHNQVISKGLKNKDITVPEQPHQLLAFGSVNDKQALPFYLSDYLELADWSGRAIHPQKRGAISTNQSKILAELAIDEDFWLEAIKNFRRQYGSFAGGEFVLKQCANQHHKCWYKGAG